MLYSEYMKQLDDVRGRIAEAGKSRAADGSIAPAANAQVFDPRKPGRSDPCPCGSGKKYKDCCGRVDSAPEA